MAINRRMSRWKSACPIGPRGRLDWRQFAQWGRLYFCHLLLVIAAGAGHHRCVEVTPCDALIVMRRSQTRIPLSRPLVLSRLGAGDRIYYEAYYGTCWTPTPGRSKYTRPLISNFSTSIFRLPTQTPKITKGMGPRLHGRGLLQP